MQAKPEIQARNDVDIEHYWDVNTKMHKYAQNPA